MRSMVITIIDINIGENSANMNILHILCLSIHSHVLFFNGISQNLFFEWSVPPLKGYMGSVAACASYHNKIIKNYDRDFII